MAAENSFKAVTLKWYETWSVRKDPSNARRILRRLELKVFNQIGTKSINSITAQMLVAIVKKIESGENSPLEIAKELIQLVGRLRFAVAHGVCERNPAADVKISDVVRNKPVVHRARIDAKELPELLRKIDAYDTQFGGDELTKLAMQLMTLTFLRTSELI